LTRAPTGLRLTDNEAEETAARKGATMGLFDGKEPEYNKISYQLATTNVRVSATRVTTSAFGSVDTELRDVHVEVVHASDIASAQQLRTGAGTSDFTVALTADGRLQSLQYKHAGSGPAVLAGTAKLIGFLASTVASVARSGALAGEGEGDVAAEGEPPDGEQPPEDPSAAGWVQAHPEAVDLLAKNKELAMTASTALVTARTDLVSATDPATIRTLNVRIDATVRALKDARAEISRLETLHQNWLDQQTTTDTATLERLVPLSAVATRTAGGGVDDGPTIPADGEPGFELYRDFGLILEVVDNRRDHTPKSATTSDPGHTPPNQVRWREPRPVELWVWAVHEDAAEAHLISRASTRIVDAHSDTHAMTLRPGAFGEHGGTWTFGDDGAPTGITTSDKSSVAAIFDALGATPEQVAGALEQVKKATDTWNGIMDADAERAKSAAERDLATAKARVELLGVNATASDAADVAKAEQELKLRTARRSTSAAADTLDDLKQELDRVKNQNDLDAANRSAVVEGDLADLKAEVARLQQEVLIAKARYEKRNPDKAGE
jgi:hypothetical protein